MAGPASVLLLLLPTCIGLGLKEEGKGEGEGESLGLTCCPRFKLRACLGLVVLWLPGAGGSYTECA